MLQTAVAVYLPSAPAPPLTDRIATFVAPPETLCAGIFTAAYDVPPSAMKRAVYAIAFAGQVRADTSEQGREVARHDECFATRAGLLRAPGTVETAYGGRAAVGLERANRCTIVTFSAQTRSRLVVIVAEDANETGR